MNTSTPQPDVLSEANVFDILGSPARRSIIEILSENPAAVGEIAMQLPISRPAVSKHLKQLQSVGFVEYKQSGARNYYRLNPSGFDVAQGWLGSFWSDALGRFKLVAENTGSEQQDE